MKLSERCMRGFEGPGTLNVDGSERLELWPSWNRCGSKAGGTSGRIAQIAANSPDELIALKAGLKGLRRAGRNGLQSAVRGTYAFTDASRLCLTIVECWNLRK